MRAVWFFVLVLALVCSLGAAVPVTGTVRDVAGKPLAGARAYVQVMGAGAWDRRSTPTREAVTGPDGVFTLDVPIAAEAVAYFTVVVHQPGLAVDFTSGRTLAPLDFVLRPEAPVKGSVLGADGKPLAGATVTLASCFRQSDDGYRHGTIPLALQDLLATKTDAHGQYTLGGVAQGVRPTMNITAAGYGTNQVSFEQQVGAVTLSRAGSVEGKLICANPAIKLADWPVMAYSETPPSRGEGMYTGSVGSTKTDAQGRFSIPELGPGEGSVRVTVPEGIGYGVKGATVEVTSGQKSTVTLTVEKLLPVKGRVIGADTKRGLPNAYVGGGETSARTGPDGTFTLMCLPGELTLYASGAGPAYRDTDYQSAKHCTLAPPGLQVGDIELQPAHHVTVLVVDMAGQPVPGASVTSEQSGDEPVPSPLRSGMRTDAQGQVVLTGLSAATLTLTATKDDLSSAPLPVDPAAQAGPVKLTLQPGRMASMTVLIQDQNGQPVTDAVVQGYEMAANWGMNRTVPPPDAQGRVTMPRLTPGHGYSFKIEAPGCWPAETPKWTAEAGQTHDCGVVTLTRNRGSVAGKVVDADGKPAAGMIVLCTLEAPKPVQTVSGADGSFRLEGLTGGNACVFVHGEGVRCTAQLVPTGTENAVLKAPAAGPLTWGAGETALATEVLPAARQQAQDLLVDALQKTKGGEMWSRWTLLLDLAKLDPQLALQTAAACGDKDESLRAVVAMTHLLDAPQDARLMLQALNPEQAQQAIMYVQGWRLADVKPELGAKIGEALFECGMRLRGADGVSGRAIALRWLQKYDPARAEALTPDLLTRAQTLGVTEREAMARMMAAQVVAAKDADAALELVKPIADDGDAQRYTAALARRIASADPQKALSILQGIKQEWNRDRELPGTLAAFPPAHRDLALAEARKIKTSTARARALAKLAQLGPRDQASGLIAEATEALLHPAARPGYADLRDEVGAMLTLGQMAHRLGCADYREIMWRGLTLYTATSAYDPPSAQRGQTQLAKHLGLADPALSRHILETMLRRVGDWTKAEAYTQRSVIAAAAASDAQWALQLVRQMPPTQDPNDRNWWSDAVAAVAKCLSQSAVARETELLREDMMGASWLAQDDSLE